jgi:hypothetical protein
MIDKDLLLVEAEKARDLLAYSVSLGERPQDAEVIGDIYISRLSSENGFQGTIAETVDGVRLLSRVKDIFMAAALNCGVYDQVQIELFGQYAYRMQWPPEA